MDLAWIWLVFGLVLMGLELVIPGLVVVFLGLAALVVAGGLGLGLISGWVAALTTWFVTSTVLTLGLRSAFTRFLPGSSRKQLTDEDLDAFGEVATVVVEVGPNAGGRIRFRGTTWAAETTSDTLAVGTKARVIARDNLVWIVEAADDWPQLPAPDPDKRGDS